MALEGFEVITGKWTLVKNEGFDEYLCAMGIGYIKRKLAQAVSTTMEIQKVGENRVRIITKGPKDMDATFNIDEEIQDNDPFDNKMVARVTWDPAAKKLRTQADPAADSKGKKSIVERTPLGENELYMEVTLPDDNVVCKRYFKRCES